MFQLKLYLFIQLDVRKMFAADLPRLMAQANLVSPGLGAFLLPQYLSPH